MPHTNDLLIAGENIDHLSASKESRPALNELMQDAHSRKFDLPLEN